MSALDKALLPQITMLQVGSQSASIELPGVRAEKNRKLSHISLINQAALAQSDTNFVEVELLDGPSGASLAKISSKTTGGDGALAKNVPLRKAVDLDIDAEKNLVINVTVGGTGVTTLAQLQLEWHPK